jgi:hypothetical protein
MEQLAMVHPKTGLLIELNNSVSKSNSNLKVNGSFTERPHEPFSRYILPMPENAYVL